jgi:DNA polymerase V
MAHSSPKSLLPVVLAGFPSPGEDYEHLSIDTNKLIIKNPAATFFMRVKGDSMNGRGIFEEDIVVIDKSLRPKNGDTVVAVVNGEYTLKQFAGSSEKPVLRPANAHYTDITFSEGDELQIWGVVSFILRQLR